MILPTMAGEVMPETLIHLTLKPNLMPNEQIFCNIFTSFA